MVKIASAIKQGTNLKIKDNAGHIGNSVIIPFPATEDNTEKYSYDDNYPENDVIEVSELKKILFQFNKPVKLEFS